MDIVAPKIEKYLIDLLPERDEALVEMEAIASKTGFPIIGPLVGRLLAQVTILSGARRILELGSGFGYSAYWFAKAVATDGKVICTDTDPKNRDRALGFFKQGGLLDRVDFRVGNALQIIEELSGEFDIILNDIDKEQYPEAFRKAVPRVKRGGLLITDNVIRSGRVAESNPDNSTKAIMEFNKLIYNTHELWTTIIPLRDGVSLTLKL
ncbi:MAG: O-methyltransferase [Bacteroidota bacterium]